MNGVLADSGGNVTLPLDVNTIGLSPFDYNWHAVTFDSNNVFTAPARGILFGSWSVHGGNDAHDHAIACFTNGKWSTIMHQVGTDYWDNCRSIAMFSLNIVVPKGLKIRYTFDGSAVYPSVYGGFYY